MDFNKKRILGMIHLSGDETNRLQRALEEIRLYEEAGLYGCIVENYHGSTDDVIEVLNALENLTLGIKVGINILPNEYHVALPLSNKFKVDFIQLDFVSGVYNNNRKLDKFNYFDYCEDLKSGIKILGGVWPKYYTPVEGSNLDDDIKEGRGMADAIVVTGSGTGKETPLDKIKYFRDRLGTNEYMAATPLIIGAGLDADNVAEQLQYADGAIVGSCFKPYKRTNEMVNISRVYEFMSRVKDNFEQ